MRRIYMKALFADNEDCDDEYAYVANELIFDSEVAEEEIVTGDLRTALVVTRSCITLFDDNEDYDDEYVYVVDEPIFDSEVAEEETVTGDVGTALVFMRSCITARVVVDDEWLRNNISIQGLQVHVNADSCENIVSGEAVQNLSLVQYFPTYHIIG